MFWIAIGLASLSLALSCVSLFFLVRSQRALRRAEQLTDFAKQEARLYEDHMKRAWRKLYPSAADQI